VFARRHDSPPYGALTRSGGLSPACGRRVSHAYKTDRGRRPGVVFTGESHDRAEARLPRCASGRTADPLTIACYENSLPRDTDPGTGPADDGGLESLLRALQQGSFGGTGRDSGGRASRFI
jgi:hypothetical protein